MKYLCLIYVEEQKLDAFSSGFILINARDSDDAIQVASKIPPARLGSVEVRPIWELTSRSRDGRMP